MRLAMSSWSVGFALLAFACADGSTSSPPPGACAVGQELCNGQCVTVGTCSTPANTGGANNDTTAPATGGSNNDSNGGQTSATGGTSSNSNSSATGGSKPATGGSSSATGGTKATGGSSAATGGSAPSDPNVCDDYATTKLTMDKDFASAYINTKNDSKKSYVAITNWWGKFTNQTVAVDGLGFTVTNSATTDNPSLPVGFPSIFIGKYQKDQSNGSNLPKQVSAIQSIPTVFESNATSMSNSDFNATYDVWLTSSSSVLSDTASSPGSNGVMLMVWMYKPANKSPRGGISSSNHTVSGVDGSWNVWVDTQANGTSPTVSYVSTSPRSGLTFDLNKFLQDAVSNNYLVKSSMYLSVVFGGLEIWSGGNNAQISKFCVKVN